MELKKINKQNSSLLNSSMYLNRIGYHHKKLSHRDMQTLISLELSRATGGLLAEIEVVSHRLCNDKPVSEDEINIIISRLRDLQKEFQSSEEFEANKESFSVIADSITGLIKALEE